VIRVADSRFNKSVVEANLAQKTSKRKSTRHSMKRTASAKKLIDKHAVQDAEHNGEKPADHAEVVNHPEDEHEKVPSLADHVTRLMEQHLMPHACKSDADGFQHRVASPEVQAVFTRHRDELKKAFSIGATYDTSKGDNHTQTLKEFIHFMDKRKVLGKGISRKEIMGVFNNSQGESDDPGDSSQDLSFSEFLEAVAACAQFTHPNPYIAFEQHVENFVTKIISTKMSHGRT